MLCPTDALDFEHEEYVRALRLERWSLATTLWAEPGIEIASSAQRAFTSRDS